MHLPKCCIIVAYVTYVTGMCNWKDAGVLQGGVPALSVRVQIGNTLTCCYIQYSTDWTSDSHLHHGAQVSLSETLVWRAAEMVQRLDLASLTAPGDEGHSEAATDVPMQMSLVSISNLTGKVR